MCTVTMNNQEEGGNLVLMKMHEPAPTILGLHVASGASINTHGIVLGSLIRDATSTDEFMYQEDCFRAVILCVIHMIEINDPKHNIYEE